MNNYLEKLDFTNNNIFIDIFEKRLSEYTGAPYVVLTDSCTNAIFITINFLKLYKNYKCNKVILPKKTYLSIPNIFLRLNIDITFKNIPWKGIYRLEGFPIYDCAVGFIPKLYIPGNYMCLSFQQKKALPIGKGGAILLDNKEDYLILKRMVHDGRDSGIPTKDDKNIIFGYHMNMPPDDAAKGTLLLNQYQFKESDIKDYTDYPDTQKIITNFTIGE
jgi:dTDP-4-amino-4,6-dideoxygalactose transaminase